MISCLDVNEIGLASKKVVPFIKVVRSKETYVRRYWIACSNYDNHLSFIVHIIGKRLT